MENPHFRSELARKGFFQSAIQSQTWLQFKEFQYWYQKLHLTVYLHKEWQKEITYKREEWCSTNVQARNFFRLQYPGKEEAEESSEAAGKIALG